MSPKFTVTLATEYMLAVYRKYAGRISSAFDGVAILVCSQNLFTVAKDDMSMFVDITQLGHHAHVTDAEAIDAVV
jgi:hypothetical protein